MQKFYTPFSKLVLVCSLLLLTACGGGGGSSDSDSDNTTLDENTNFFKEPASIASWTTDGTGSEIYANTPLQPKPGDFNNDGHMDFVVTYAGSANPDTVGFPNGPHVLGIPFRIYLNDTNGGFYDGTASIISGTVPGSLFIRTIQIADFNGDGLTDLFLGEAPELSQDTTLWAYADLLFLSNASTEKLENKSNQLIWVQPDWPNISAVRAINERYTHESDQSDFDKDGDIDLLLSTSSKSGTVIMVNDGNGVFTEHTQMGKNLSNLNAGSLKSAFADVNNDGAVDYINPSSDQTSGDNAVFLNDTIGNFNALPSIALPAPILLEDSSEDIEATDVNGDGFMDAILLNTKFLADGGGQHFIQVLINDGTGNFTDETSSRFDVVNDWPANTNPLFDVIDMNNDGVKDIVIVIHNVLNHFEPHVDDWTQIWINVDGVFTLVETNLPILLNELGIADFNNDGLMDIVSYKQGSTTTDNINFRHELVLIEANKVLSTD